MQVDSSPPFTSIAQAMGQADQAPAPPSSGDGASVAVTPAPAVSAAAPSGVGETLDLTV